VARSTVSLATKASRSEDPAEGLAAVAALRRDLDALATRHVARAVERGWSWSRIAETLGVSKQAAHQRYAKRASARPPSGARRADTLPISPLVREAVRAAREEAAALNAESLTSEHLLVGLLRTQGHAGEALAGAGVSLGALRPRVSARTSPADPGAPPAKRRPTLEARRSMEAAFRDALARNAPELGVEHVLRGIMREDGAAAALVEDLGATPARVERELERAIAGARGRAK
jgi:Clp amino terminal domain, pathogenicity island component